MRTLPMLLVAVLIAALLVALEWLAATAAVAPTSVPGATAAACAAHRDPPTASNARVGAAVRTDQSFAVEPTLAAESGRAWERRCDAPAGVQVVDGAGRPQPDLPIGLCTTERLAGRPCVLPLGHTDAQGFLALPPHRVGLLVVDTAGGRIGSVVRSAAAGSPTVQLVLQATGALLVLVVDAAGRPLDGARIELSGPFGMEVVRSDAAGRAPFPQLALDHELTLRASAAGRSAELRLPAHRPAGRTLQHVVVLAAAPQLLLTTVLDADGVPLREQLLRCTFADGHSLRTTSDAHGRLTIPLPGQANGQPPAVLGLRIERLDAMGRLHGASAFVSVTQADGTTSAMPVRLLPSARADLQTPGGRRRPFGFTGREQAHEQSHHASPW